MLTKFQNWLKQPYSSDMDVLHWFLFFGMLLVVSAIWKMILSHVD